LPARSSTVRKLLERQPGDESLKDLAYRIDALMAEKP